MLPEQLPLPLARLGSATGNPARVIGVHFFNPLIVPYLLHAVRMLKAGIASAEDIDNGMRLGCGLPMGPLAPVSCAVMASPFAAGSLAYR